MFLPFSAAVQDVCAHTRTNSNVFGHAENILVSKNLKTKQNRKREKLCPCVSNVSQVVSEADRRPVNVKLWCVSAHTVQSVPKRSVHQSDAVCTQGDIPTVWCHLSRHTAAASCNQTINQLQMNHNNIENKQQKQKTWQIPGKWWRFCQTSESVWKQNDN